jgi:endonuclease YncB( thermonuclease family)
MNISATNTNIDTRDITPIDIHNNIISWGETCPFIFPIREGQVIKVYDGDTITIAAYMPYADGASPLFRFSVRLNGIDTPEIKGHSEEEKKAAKQSRSVLNDKLMHHVVTLKNVQTEKYGRILADVYLGDLHVNQWMLDNNYAVKYDGGKKDVFTTTTPI